MEFIEYLHRIEPVVLSVTKRFLRQAFHAAVQLAIVLAVLFIGLYVIANAAQWMLPILGITIAVATAWLIHSLLQEARQMFSKGRL